MTLPATQLEDAAQALHVLADFILMNLERGTLDRATEHLLEGTQQILDEARIPRVDELVAAPAASSNLRVV